MRTGHVDRSLELANAALALADARPDAAHGILASVLIHRGEALLERRRFEEAAADCRRALGLIEAESPLTPEDPTDEPITCLGRAVIGLGRLEEGLAHLERAVSLTKREEKVTLALSRFALAKALTSAGRDAPRARKLAEQAAEDLRRYPALGAKQSQVERWLASPFGIEEAASK
jgi:tetratricopeptide (TPR) repeat protein